jgi:two-component system, chemotaxis family, sensor kinase CheA
LEEWVASDQGSLDPAEFVAGYLQEVDEHLAAAARNLIAVEADLKRGGSSPRAIRELFRSLHTVKGLSAMVGIEPLVDLSHALESVLREADAAGGKIDEAGFDLLMKGLNAIEHRVRALARKEAVAPAPADLLRLLGQLKAPGDSTADRPPIELSLAREVADKLSASEHEQLASAASLGRRAVRIDVAPTPARMKAGFTISAVRTRLSELGDIVKVVPISRPVTGDEPSGVAFALLVVSAASDDELATAAGCPSESIVPLVAAGQPGALSPAAGASGPASADEVSQETAGAGAQGVVRVEVARLDDAMEKLSALIVTRFRFERAVAELAATGAEVRPLRAILVDNGRQIRDLRAAIMKARMVSAADLFERVPLLVRRLARETGKRVRLELDAGQAELDKAVGERIFPAIVHLIRNAVDHGLESSEERRRLRKDEEGCIRLSCLERGNSQLEIMVGDDGRGIDGRALARRAGREPPRTADELLSLMVTPGLSTREQASTTSGRGLGMDIVKRVVVDELGGTMAVQNTVGQGTAFALTIPLTVTIVEAFSFRCGPQSFVVPVAGVEEILEVQPSDVVRAPSGKGRAEMRLIERRGTAVPLVSLHGLFHLGSAEAMPASKAILIQRAGQLYAFEVDRMLGQQEVVVRPLQDPLVKQPGIVGSTDLGDGQPTLVLDLFSLSAKLTRRKTDLRP